jgi:hypothetical protein
MNIAEEVDLYVKGLDKKPPPNVVDSFKVICERSGLSPLSRQIYLIERGGKWAPQTSIDGLRMVANRQEKYLGQDGPYWTEGPGQPWTDIPPEKPPYAAKVGIFVAGAPAPTFGVAKFSDYNAGSGLWKKFPGTMIAKCAESLALRKALPGEMVGLYTDEEMGQAEAPVKREAPKKAANPTMTTSGPSTKPYPGDSTGSGTTDLDALLGEVEACMSEAELDTKISGWRTTLAPDMIIKVAGATKTRRAWLKENAK